MIYSTALHPDVHVVTRTLTVQGMTNGDSGLTISRGLSILPGIQRVSTNWSQGEVLVTYDILEIRMDEVIDALETLGFMRSEGLISRIQRGWTRFTEQNAVDNALYEPHCCCNRPPLGA